METVIYFIRHSKSLRPFKYGNWRFDGVALAPLSIDGESKAKALSKIEELKNLQVVVSSQFARATGTAKYLCDENKLELIIDERLKERKIGNLQEDGRLFHDKQFNDFDYKLEDGESLNDCKKRIKNIIEELLGAYPGKRIAVVSHNTLILSFLSMFCKIDLDEKKWYFANKLVYDDNIDMPSLCVYKCTFDGGKLTSLKLIDTTTK